MQSRFILFPFILILLFQCCKENHKNHNSQIDELPSIASSLDSFLVDTSQSIIYWLGSSPTSKHNGSLKFLGGTLYSNNKIFEGGNLYIDMNSIHNLDMDNPSDIADLENHLKSDDFFNVRSFPVAKINITSVLMNHNSINNANVIGTLNLKNVNKEIKLNCKIDHTDDIIMLTVPEFTIDRTEYNIMYQSKKILNTLKDGFIHDEVTLSVKLIATKAEK